MTLAEAWKFFQELLPMLGLIAALLVLWLGTKFVRHNSCERYRQGMQNLLEENTANFKELDKNILSLPTAKDLDGMKSTVASLTTEVSVLREQLKGQNALFERLESQVDRIDAFLKKV